MVEYSTIVNFQQHGLRTLATKYSSATDEVRIRNGNNPDEEVLLLFAEQQYLIACDWNQIRFVGQGQLENITDRQGPLSLFLDFVGDIEEYEGFGNYEQARIRKFSLSEDGDTEVTELEGFLESSFSEEIEDTFSNAHDASFIFTREREGIRRELQCGPFTVQDVEEHNLRIFRTPGQIDYDTQEGLLVRSQVVKNIAEFGLEQLAIIEDERVSIVEQLMSTI